MKSICELLQFLTVAALGVFAGAQLTEGLVLVPFWQSLSAADFFAWYAANGERLLGFFGPLTTATALIAIATAVASLWTGHPSRWFSVLAAVLSIAVVSMFFLYFQEANASFTGATIRADDLAVALQRWATWHWVRTGFSLVALLAGLLAFHRRT